jgi:hypothetical protein
MTDRMPPPPIDDAQAALIDRRLDQFGSFMQSVLRSPEIADEIPDGATLAFHDLWIGGDPEPVRLTAYRAAGAMYWNVLLTDAPGISKGLPSRPQHSLLWAVRPLIAQTAWETPDEAFAAIEAVLQRADEAHLLAG